MAHSSPVFPQVGDEPQDYNYEITPLGTPFVVRKVGSTAFIVNTQPLDFESQSLWPFTVSLFSLRFSYISVMFVITKSLWQVLYCFVLFHLSRQGFF